MLSVAGIMPTSLPLDGDIGSSLALGLFFVAFISRVGEEPYNNSLVSA